jgi:hypothetical protein
MTRTAAKALSVARPVLYGLMGLNLLYALGISVLLLGSFLFRERLLGPLGLDIGSEPEHAMTLYGLRAVVLVGLVGVGLVHLILKRLLALVASVRAGDPFILDNARRLEHIAWCVLGMEGLRVLVHAIAKLTYTLDEPLRMDNGFSFTPWLAVLLLFILAGVFAQGARMRSDLEGTV